ncbi:hypothetical protein DdX_01004 [Ditylenchus destructor]|uniref:Uncharacterized protein n=1 Tax=Ditylenchus destructor TaxID=166010 RepID=A0AAD4NG13_9BILA|nr:hypothetical protein DdX_01004 [Ditylenchus destructor]
MIILLLLCITISKNFAEDGASTTSTVTSTTYAGLTTQPFQPRKCPIEGKWNRIKSCNCSLLNGEFGPEAEITTEDKVLLQKQTAQNIVQNLSHWCDTSPNALPNVNETAYKGNLTSFAQAIFLCSLNNRAVSRKKDQKLYRNFAVEYLRWALYEVCDGDEHIPVTERERASQQTFSGLLRFLFEKENLQRDLVCQTMENQTVRTLNTCQGEMDDSFAKRCKSDKPYDFEWFVLSAFSDAYINNQTWVVNPFHRPNNSVEWADSLAKFVEGSHRFRTVHAAVAESFVIGNQLVRQFLMSTLMLNNFGRSVRQTQRLIDKYCGNMSNNGAQHSMKVQVRIECDKSLLYARTETTLGVTDLQPLITAENFHNFFHIILLIFGLACNVYICVLLRSCGTSLNPTSVTLIQILLCSNIIFTLVNVVILIEQQIPIINRNNFPPDFPLIQGFDGDIMSNVTFLANIETLGIVLNKNYGENPLNYNGTLASRSAQIILISENLVLDLSRTIAGTMLFVIMCFVLYELRTCFCGYISRHTATGVRFGLALWFGAITSFYFASGVFQFLVISKINELMALGSVNVQNYQNACVQLQETYKHESYYLKGHTIFTIFFYIGTFAANLVLFGYHKLKEITTAFPISDTVKEEMRVSLISLFLSTIVYVLSNFGLTYVQLQIMIKDCTEPECVSWASTAYHWLYLASLTDPILQPVIILYRMRCMRVTHFHWLSIWRQFEIGPAFTNSIRFLYFNIFPSEFKGAHNLPNSQKFSTNQSPLLYQNVTFNPSGPDNTVKNNEAPEISMEAIAPHRKSGIRAIGLDNDLKSMLQYLEQERKGNRVGSGKVRF